MFVYRMGKLVILTKPVTMLGEIYIVTFLTSTLSMKSERSKNFLLRSFI